MRKKWIAAFAALAITAVAFTEDFPEYLKIEEERHSRYPFADLVIPNVVTGYTDSVPANLVIPNGVTKIRRNAFRD